MPKNRRVWLLERTCELKSTYRTQAYKVQIFQKHLMCANVITKNYSQSKFIEEFSLFRIPSTTEMPESATVMKMWHY